MGFRRGLVLPIVLAVGVWGAPAPASHADVEMWSCASYRDVVEPPRAAPPRDLLDLIDAHLADERLAGLWLGMSVWIEGFGEVVAVNPDLRLRPASNQKLLTAMGALEILGSDATLHTELVVDGAIENGVLAGDLYLLGGGDPTLTVDGPHSLEALAAATREAGVIRVTGNVLADESRYDMLRRANGWSYALAPAWVGSLSAVVVDENRLRAHVAYLADPAGSAAHELRRSLLDAGVAVDGVAGTGEAPSDASRLITRSSPPVADLVGTMLADSNNTYAELLVKEVGYQASRTGSTAAGLASIAAVLSEFCLPRTILQHDGSGLSHGNARSARSWRQLLHAAQGADWWPALRDGLAVAGESGTLQFRFRDTAAQGNLRAKTGTITGLRSLSGYLTTASGRHVVFSAIVDGDEPRRGMTAVDDLLVSLAAYEG